MIGPSFIGVIVGNTRTQIGRFAQGALAESERFANSDVTQIVMRVLELARRIAADGKAPIVLASVNEPVAGRIESGVQDQLDTAIYRVGRDLPIPIGTRLDPETITGVDRLLNAAGAFAQVGQACIIVDAGSAVTVDFVDGEGTFHGGSIAPGARMQLRALHEHTAALPEVEFSSPDGETFGRSTTQAMLQGVFHGIRGMVWKLVERYAEAYGAYPQVIATGGDAEILFRDDHLIDNIVPALTLRGLGEAVRTALADSEDDGGQESLSTPSPR